MVGQKFGKLIVIEEDFSHPKKKLWLCKCKCGKDYLVEEEKLLNKTITHCLCGRGDNLSNIKYERLTAICATSLRTSDRCVIWKCLCDCGNIAYVSAKALKQKNTKSCGCLNTEVRAALGRSHKKDLTGEQFGELTVIGDVGKRRGLSILWECKCSCGALCYIPGTALKGGAVSCGCVKSKGEQKIAALLTQNNISFVKNKTFPTCKFENGYFAYFDFFVDNHYLIEYDGLQHFQTKTGGWNTEEQLKETQIRDAYKTQWCQENNVPLIRIPYTKLKELTIEDLIYKSEPNNE